MAATTKNPGMPKISSLQARSTNTAGSMTGATDARAGSPWTSSQSAKTAATEQGCGRRGAEEATLIAHGDVIEACGRTTQVLVSESYCVVEGVSGRREEEGECRKGEGEGGRTKEEGRGGSGDWRKGEEGRRREEEAKEGGARIKEEEETG